MISRQRLRAAFKASSIHFLGSLIVAALSGVLVFLVWYPNPYQELAGGRELFLIVMAVDVVCGPLLTAILFDRRKPRAELWRDLGMVVLIQVAALGYGLDTVWRARPLFLVMEKDRFQVVAAPDLQDKSASDELARLSSALKPGFLTGPVTVAIREPLSSKERNSVMFEAIQGGRDYAMRPSFYLPYEGENALKSVRMSKPLSVFLSKQPSQEAAAQQLAVEKHADIALLRYVPVMGRQDWVAVLNTQGQIEGFLKGDGY